MGNGFNNNLKIKHKRRVNVTKQPNIYINKSKQIRNNLKDINSLADKLRNVLNNIHLNNLFLMK